MNPLGFSRLLARLDPDPDRAAGEYERLRATLEKYFDWRGAWPPEECADETLDRLVQKLDSDTQIHDVRSYAHGIARLVLLEWRRRRPLLVSMSDDPRAARIAQPIAEEGDEEFQLCFTHCLGELPEESRTLVLRYYAAERREKIDNRRHLAQAFGISEGALRNRIQRVRERLERCVEACVGAAALPVVPRGSAGTA